MCTHLRLKKVKNLICVHSLVYLSVSLDSKEQNVAFKINKNTSIKKKNANLTRWILTTEDDKFRIS